MRPSFTFWLAILLGIFALLWILKPPPRSENSPTKAAWADIYGGIKTALDSYESDNGAYPKSLQDLVQKPGDATNWHGPYVDPPKLPIDPWGHAYIYEYPGKHNTNSYDLFSAGPDGKAGTEDDIVNWTN